MKSIADLIAPLVSRALDRRQKPAPLPVEPFDFQAAIALDPRAVPQDDRPVPEWLRLPLDDQP